jgi:hypothetical protein
MAEEQTSQLHRGEGLTIRKGNIFCEQKPTVLADLWMSAAASIVSL